MVLGPAACLQNIPGEPTPCFPWPESPGLTQHGAEGHRPPANILEGSTHGCALFGEVLRPTAHCGPEVGFYQAYSILDPGSVGPGFGSISARLDRATPGIVSRLQPHHRISFGPFPCRAIYKSIVRVKSKGIAFPRRPRWRGQPACPGRVDLPRSSILSSGRGPVCSAAAMLS